MQEPGPSTVPVTAADMCMMFVRYEWENMSLTDEYNRLCKVYPSAPPDQLLNVLQPFKDWKGECLLS